MTVKPEMAAAGKGRILAIDMARGLAIIGMIVYHFTWDLRFLGFTALDVTTEPGWVAFQRLLIGTFLVLAGVSLVFAHGSAIRWRAFWTRFALIGGAALLVTIGTYVFYAPTFVYFGVLHAIALFSLLALPFLRAPLWLVLATALVVLLLPLFVEHPIFGLRIWSWIGLWDTPPPSEDLVPIFPWFGAVLAGVALTRLIRGTGFFDRLRALPADALPARALVAAGRWSLAIYLVHQPVLIGALTLAANVIPQSTEVRAANFTSSCEASCIESNGSEQYCIAYCACTLGNIESQDLWAMLEAPQRSEADEQFLVEMTNQCAAEVIENQ